MADAASKKEWQRSKFEAAVSAAHKFWEPQQEGRELRSTRKGYAASAARQNPRVASKKRLNFVSLRGRKAAVAIFKPKVWHPVAKRGSTKRKGILIAKNGIRRFIPRNHISFRDDKSLR